MKRFLLIALLVLAVGAVPLGVHAYSALCAGPVNAYSLLANPRNQAQRELRTPAKEPITVTAPAEARVSVLDVLLGIKEADPIAFPAHVVVGLALQAGGCPLDATGDQWRKAAAHAWTDGAAHIAALGLNDTIGKADSSAAVVTLLQSYAQDEPWHDADLSRVQAAYAALCSGGVACASG